MTERDDEYGAFDAQHTQPERQPERQPDRQPKRQSGGAPDRLGSAWYKIRRLVGRAISDSAQGTVGRTAQDAYGATVEGLKGLGDGSLKKTAQTFDEAHPFIKRAGFRVTQIDMGMGLSPRLTPHLRIERVLSEDEQAALLLEVRERTVIRAVLASLFRAVKTSEALAFSDFSLCELELELSLLPTVVVKFLPSDDSRVSDMCQVLDNTETGLLEAIEADGSDTDMTKA